MKKLLLICLTLVVSGACFAAMPAKAYDPIVSPTAPTYTDITQDTTKGQTRTYTIPFDPTEISKILSEVSSRISASNVSNVSTVTNVPSTVTTITFTNIGKDDPDSPNYTGNRGSVIRDDSSRSPDTATGSNAAPIAVALLTMAGAGVFAAKALKKKEESED